MSISIPQFKNAFRETVSSEFSHIPTNENDISYTFSPQFDKKMNKLIKSQKNIYWNFTNTVSKRIAVVCAAMLLLFATACSIKPIREPIIDFVINIYDTFTEYLFKGELKQIINYEYRINSLPDGFEQTNKQIDNNSITTNYQNESGEMIIFVQTISDGTQVNFDTEKHTQSTTSLLNTTIDFFENDLSKTAIWTKDGYVFNLICYGEFQNEDLEKIILSIQ